MEDDFLKGGAHELSGVLERRTKEDPERFAHLALRFPDDTHHYYFDAVLRGISEAGVSTQTLLEVCQRCHELPERPSGRWICDAVEKAAERPLPDELLEIVAWYATDDRDPEQELWRADAGGGQPYYGGDISMAGLNSARGRAAIAMAGLISHDADRIPLFLKALERMVEDTSIAVRSCVASTLTAVLIHDRDLAVGLFEQLCEIQIMKDYMESGSFARGREELPAEASMVFLGNLNEPPERLARKGHLFVNLPDAMIDAAFLDRMHFYLPGWDAPKMEQRYFSDNYGFISDYLAEALRASRLQNYSAAIEEEFAFGEQLNARDERAVRKTVSGLLKILHPHGEWIRAELREYLELALEGRRRIKEQLKKLAPHEYSKTAFSYIERDTGMEFWVEVAEQPDTAVAETIDAEKSELPMVQEPQRDGTEPKRLSVEELISRGESQKVEFKASARWNLHKGDRDQAIEREIVKAIAGFMNAHGGTLLVGVNDDHEPVGLEKDYKLTKKGSRDPRDSFENWLTDLLDGSIGKPALANLSVSFESMDGHDVCRVDVKPSRQPVYARGKQSMDFYVRLNNGTRSLNVEEAVSYIAAHEWGVTEAFQS